MSSAERELEEALVEVGGRLRSPPDADEALLELLDKADTYLARVDQSPSPSILAALGPAKEALVAKNLMGHSNMEVKVAVASCVSEITRITAPEAPYDDDRMKVIFQMIVEAFGKLDDLSSRSFPKRLSILETVAKVRSCVVMLDLECDALILDMFRFFLKTIRPDHPDKVFSSMELIMTLVLEESEDISAELISCLLNSVKMDNKEVLPVGRRLGEKVISKCATKLKPFLVQAQSLSGLCEYSKVVASIISDALEQNETDSTGEILGDDSKLSERTVSDDLPEGSMKTAEEGGSPEKVAIADKSPIMNNGTIQSGDGGFTIEPTSSNRKPEVSGRSGESKDVVSLDGADSDDLESTELKSDSFLDRKTKKMKGRKPNSSVQVMDTREDSRNDSDEVPPAPRNIEGRKETGNSQIEARRVKEAESTMSLEPEDNNDLHPTRRSDNGSASHSSPTPSEDVLDTKKSKRGRPFGSKGSSKRRIKDTAADPPASTSEEKGSVLDDQDQDELPSEDTNVKKDPEATGKKKRSETAHEVEKTSLSSDPVAKSAPKTGKRGLKKKVKGGSSRKKQKSNVKQTEGIFSLEKDATGESSLKISGTHDNPDQNLKLDESLVGSKIQVWWPDDEMFYAGRVDSFDPSNGRHKIVYEDDEIEILLLKEERFELIGDGGEMEGDLSKDFPSPPEVFPSPPEVKRSNKKAKANSGGSVSKQGKKQTPMQSDEQDSGGVKSLLSKPKGRPPKKSKETSASISKDEIPKTTGHDSSDERDSEVMKSPASRPKGRSLKKSKDTPASKSLDETPKTIDPDWSDDTDGGDVKDTFVKPRGRPRKKLKETSASKSEDETPKTKSGRKAKDDSLTIDSKVKEDSPKTSSKLMDVDTPKAAGKAKDDSVKAKSSQTTPKGVQKKKSKGDVTPQTQTIEESSVDGSSEKGKGSDRATERSHTKSHETETPTKTQASQGSMGNSRKRKAPRK